MKMDDTMKIVGIDEAGRGPVIGPMVIVGILILSENDINRLDSLGVKDSKMLTPKKREELFSMIIKIIDDYKILIISPEEIDSRIIKHKTLNQLELEKMAEIINFLNPDKVYIDCPDINVKRFTRNIKPLIKNDKCEIIAEHDADKKYPIVSAASIIAKVKRDSIIQKMKQKFGDFGSGYPSDPKTKQFLIDFYVRKRTWPPIVRRTWETIKEIEVKFGNKQKKLDSYL